MMRPETSVVFLPCGDILKTTHFYHDILKFPIAESQGDNLVIFDTGYGYWGFCEYTDGRALLSGSQGVCLSVNLKDEDAVRVAYEHLKDQCEIYKAPAKHPVFPVYSFFLLDPDGYLVEYQKTG